MSVAGLWGGALIGFWLVFVFTVASAVMGWAGLMGVVRRLRVRSLSGSRFRSRVGRGRRGSIFPDCGSMSIC